MDSGCKGREIGNEKWIAIVDLHQISYKNVDPRGLITGFQFLQVSANFYFLFSKILHLYVWVN